MATIETFLQDFRYAWRVLRREPGFTFFAVLTIALALGANAAIFSLVDGVLLKSAGYPEPERIVQIWEKQPSGGRNGIAPANYIDWTRLATSFEAMAANSGAGLSYLPSQAGSLPISLRAAVVSAPYFDVFGVKAALGRTFAADEDQRGKEKVTVLTHRLWTTLFGGDQQIIGKPILLNGEAYNVIGVLPGASEFERRSSDLYIPLAFPPNARRRPK
jgi:putative ABC transport system permease protein